MNFPRYISLGGVLVCLAGCAVGPDYQRPAVAPTGTVPTTFSDGSTNQVTWKLATPLAGHPRGEWWQCFADSELDRLEVLAQTNNQSLAAAAARFNQARDLVSAARAGFYPQLTAGGTPNGDLSRVRSSQNAPEQGGPAGRPFTYDNFTAPLYLGWEADLWGRVRRTAEGARDRYAAAGDDLESARLEVASEVALDYFTLRALETEQTVISDTITTYQRSLELTENLRRGGAVSDLDVAQAATQLHSAEGQLPVIELSVEQTRNALALLCGQPPTGFAPLKSGGSDAIPVLPSVVPSALLEQRPDIAAAERRMMAANADVGVARAAFYPTIKLDGLAGFQSVGFDTWFNWPSRFWSVGPSVTLPIFTGGLNRARLAQARHAYDEAVANYRQTVLSAFVDVENALAAQHWLTQQWQAENAALVSSRQALRVAENRYRAGLTTYLDVATAQASTLQHERTVVELAGQRQTAVVNLVKALGGGWQAASGR